MAALFARLRDDQRNSLCMMTGTVGAVGGGGGGDGVTMTSFIQLLAERFEMICCYCPNFLFATVLEGMLGELMKGDSVQTLEEAYRQLKQFPGVKNVEGFRIGLKVLKGCAMEGSNKYFAHLTAMTPDQIQSWRENSKKM